MTGLKKKSRLRPRNAAGLAMHIFSFGGNDALVARNVSANGCQGKSAS
jgi:hypothetical protein